MAEELRQSKILDFFSRPKKSKSNIMHFKNMMNEYVLPNMLTGEIKRIGLVNKRALYGCVSNFKQFERAGFDSMSKKLSKSSLKSAIVSKELTHMCINRIPNTVLNPYNFNASNFYNLRQLYIFNDPLLIFYLRLDKLIALKLEVNGQYFFDSKEKKYKDFNEAGAQFNSLHKLDLKINQFNSYSSVVELNLAKIISLAPNLHTLVLSIDYFIYGIVGNWESNNLKSALLSIKTFSLEIKEAAHANICWFVGYFSNLQNILISSPNDIYDFDSHYDFMGKLANLEVVYFNYNSSYRDIAFEFPPKLRQFVCCSNKLSDIDSTYTKIKKHIELLNYARHLGVTGEVLKYINASLFESDWYALSENAQKCLKVLSTSVLSKWADVSIRISVVEQIAFEEANEAFYKLLKFKI